MIEENDTRQFLLKNLHRTKDESGNPRYAWRLNLEVIANDIEEVGLPIHGSSELPFLFIRGSRSNYVAANQLTSIRSQFPNAELVSLKTGHWVHAEDPDGLFDAIMN